MANIWSAALSLKPCEMAEGLFCSAASCVRHVKIVRALKNVHIVSAARIRYYRFCYFGNAFPTTQITNAIGPLVGVNSGYQRGCLVVIIRTDVSVLIFAGNCSF